MQNGDIPWVKGVLLGNSGAGKTTLWRAWDQENKPHPLKWGGTIGVDFHQKTYEDVPVRLMLWDTAGQERFRSLSIAYYRGASLVFLVVDITETVAEIVHQIEFWIEDLTMRCPPSSQRIKFTALYIVANKMDLLQHPTDKVAELESAAGESVRVRWMGMRVYFVSTSATEYIGVEDLFRSAVYFNRFSFVDSSRKGAVRLPELDEAPKRRSTAGSRCSC